MTQAEGSAYAEVCLIQCCLRACFPSNVVEGSYHQQPGGCIYFWCMWHPASAGHFPGIKGIEARIPRPNTACRGAGGLGDCFNFELWLEGVDNPIGKQQHFDVYPLLVHVLSGWAF